MKEHVIEAEGLFARCICHERDHLDGILYTEKTKDGLYDVDEEEEGKGLEE